MGRSNTLKCSFVWYKASRSPPPVWIELGNDLWDNLQGSNTWFFARQSFQFYSCLRLVNSFNFCLRGIFMCMSNPHIKKSLCYIIPLVGRSGNYRFFSDRWGREHILFQSKTLFSLRRQNPDRTLCCNFFTQSLQNVYIFLIFGTLRFVKLRTE